MGWTARSRCEARRPEPNCLRLYWSEVPTRRTTLATTLNHRGFDRAHRGREHRGDRIIFRSKAVGVVASVLAAATLFAACGGRNASPEILRHAEPPSEFGGGGPLGLIGGVLDFHEDTGCVTLNDRSAVWPAGTEIETDPFRVRFTREGETAEVGDRVQGGGLAGVDLSSLRDAADVTLEGDVDHFRRCAINVDGTIVGFLFNARANITVRDG